MTMKTTRIALVVAAFVAGCGESGPNNNFGGGGSTSMNGGNPGNAGGASVGTGGAIPGGTGGTVQSGTGGNIGAGGVAMPGTGGKSGTGAVTGTGGSTPGTGGVPSMGTGGAPPKGGSSGTGSNTGTGGAPMTGTGGNVGTGGKPATATGGSTPGTGGMIVVSTGGAPGTGGMPMGTGGAPPSTGGNTGTGGMVSGTGGMITSTGGAPANTGGAPGTGGAMPMMTPFGCGSFQEAFATQNTAIYDIAAFGDSSVYAAGVEQGQKQLGHLFYWNGTTATEQSLPVPANSWVAGLYGVWGSSSNDVWVGGFFQTQAEGAPDGVGPVTPTVYHRVNGGAWQRDMSIPFGANVKNVVSITGSSSNDVSVMAKVWNGDAQEDVVVFRKSGNSWMQMSLPAHSLPVRMTRIKAIGNQLFAVGARMTGDPLNNVEIGAVLWKFDGSAWGSVSSVPSDLVVLYDVSGADGYVTVVGPGSDGPRLTTADMNTWTRSAATAAPVNAVWMPRIGAALVAGPGGEGGLQGVMAVMSMASWGPDTLIGNHGIRVIKPVPGTMQVFAGAEGGVIRATCQ